MIHHNFPVSLNSTESINQPLLLAVTSSGVTIEHNQMQGFGVSLVFA